MRTLLFHRKYRRFHGGHLKVWHYFNHALATPDVEPLVLFDDGSSWDNSNPWIGSRDRVVDSAESVSPDLLFVAGRDWQRMELLGLLDRELPVINLIQHVRHADEWSIQSRYLDRKAIRICVSDEVANAVIAAGSRGPTVVIPNGIDVPLLDHNRREERVTDLLIAGLKQPALAKRLGDRLQASGRVIEILTDHIEREDFFAAMRRARVTLFLPNEEEGFYLPALEGMALETLVVCPDCVGNRSFCLPGFNAFRPEYEFENLANAAESALSMSRSERESLVNHGRATASAHSLDAERASFSDILRNLDDIWLSA